jgi:hypothetical protein
LTNYIIDIDFLGDSKKGSSTTATVFDKILIFFKDDLSMESGDKIIENWDLIGGISSQSTSFVFEGEVVGMRHFTLLYYQFIVLIFLFQVVMSGFSLQITCMEFQVLLGFEGGELWRRVDGFHGGVEFGVEAEVLIETIEPGLNP